MIKNTSRSPSGPGDDFALLSLRVFWCSDCHENQLFERPQTEMSHHSEWACTDCGAAYFDGIDMVIGVSDPEVGVA